MTSNRFSPFTTFVITSVEKINFGAFCTFHNMYTVYGVIFVREICLPFLPTAHPPFFLAWNEALWIVYFSQQPFSPSPPRGHNKCCWWFCTCNFFVNEHVANILLYTVWNSNFLCCRLLVLASLPPPQCIHNRPPKKNIL